jgi:hypothetical protein
MGHDHITNIQNKLLFINSCLVIIFVHQKSHRNFTQISKLDFTLDEAVFLSGKVVRFDIFL